MLLIGTGRMEMCRLEASPRGPNNTESPTTKEGRKSVLEWLQVAISIWLVQMLVHSSAMMVSDNKYDKYIPPKSLVMFYNAFLKYFCGEMW